MNCKKTWTSKRLLEVIDFNPKETLRKGQRAKKIAMEQLRPFSKSPMGYCEEFYNGGAKFKNGDTLLARITPCLENGKTAQVNELEEGEVGFGSTEYIVLRAKEGKSDKDFIYYLSISPNFRSIAIKSMVGSSGRQRVQQNVLENAEFLLPDLKTQKKISAVLGSLDNKIELNEKINQNLEAQAQAILYKCKSNLSKSEIGDYLYFINGFAFKSSSYVSNGTFKIVTIKNVKDGKIDSIGSDSINEIPYGMPPDCFLDIGDGLMSLTGNVGRIGIVCEKKLLLNQRVAKIVPKETAWKGLAYFIMRFPETKSALKSIAHGTAQANLSTNDSLKVKLSFPVDITSNFAKILNSYYIKIQKNNMGSILLAQLRDALLPKLMSGEIDVSEVAV